MHRMRYEGRRKHFRLLDVNEISFENSNSKRGHIIVIQTPQIGCSLSILPFTDKKKKCKPIFFCLQLDDAFVGSNA